MWCTTMKYDINVCLPNLVKELYSWPHICQLCISTNKRYFILNILNYSMFILTVFLQMIIWLRYFKYVVCCGPFWFPFPVNENKKLLKSWYLMMLRLMSEIQICYINIWSLSLKICIRRQIIAKNMYAEGSKNYSCYSQSYH